MSDQILTLRSVVAGYGAGDILKGVDLDVRKGTVTCLIGPNGAGKSTVLKCVSGLLRPRAGTVTFRGEELGKLSPRDRLLRGIVHVPQDRSLFPAMSVWDNLLMGGYAMKDQRDGLPPNLSKDGVHPTAAGYAIMAPLVEAGIKSALAQ